MKKRFTKERIIGVLKEDLMVSTNYDYQFHRFIMRCSRNRLFAELYDRFQKVFHQTQMLPYARQERLVEAVDEHGRIVDALERRDAEQASHFLGQHLLRATQRIGITMDHVSAADSLPDTEILQASFGRRP